MTFENSFLQLSKSVDEQLLFRMRPTALLLLWQIAARAKRTLNHPDKTLLIGEAFIGDWRLYTKSERCYRSDKEFLQKHEKVTFRTTSKGTIARIISTSPIYINEEQVTNKMSINSRLMDEHKTTNNNVKYENNDKKNTASISSVDRAITVIQEVLREKYLFKDGLHYYLKGGSFVTIHDPVKFAASLVSSKKTISLNPILEDPLFEAYRNVYSGSDDSSVRRKMSIEPVIFSRYPSSKYEEQWTEAKKVLQRV